MSFRNSILQIYSFDGQTVWLDKGTELFEVGNFLGGGAAGNVYECEHSQSHEHFALKILNPLGYKILSPTLLRKCTVISKGKIYCDSDKSSEVLAQENLWWLMSGTKQYIAAYYSERYNSLRELSLTQCIQLWGTDPTTVGEDDGTGVIFSPLSSGSMALFPSLPPKYVDFVRRRNRIFREIRNMDKINDHINVIRLEGVLELTQDSKCTIFLVMELANGGELFDRIKLDCGAREGTANFFFQQMLLGVKHCHDQGVCHRDLKPENLLLQDYAGSNTVLKIADFGFSARFAMSMDAMDPVGSPAVGLPWRNDASLNSTPQKSQQKDYMDGPCSAVASSPYTPSSSYLLEESPLRVLKSVVGSPFYVAPEVMQATGYDGPKADVWSLGVILYAMLAGNLPFGQELSVCKRFRHFCKWVREETARGVVFTAVHGQEDAVEFPSWLFPVRFSAVAKCLIVAMLHPDPDRRISVAEAMEFSSGLSGSKASFASSDSVGLAGEGAVPTVHSAVEVHSTQFSEERKVAMDVSTGGCGPCGFAKQAADGDGDGQEDQEEMFAMEEEQQLLDDAPSSTGIMQAQRTADSMQGAVRLWELRHTEDTVLPVVPQLASVCSLKLPLVAPDDLLVGASPIRLSSDESHETLHVRNCGQDSTMSSDRSVSTVCNPPSFTDAVKRSTRFITAVPAAVVLDQVESILEAVRFQRVVTPIGFVGKVVLDWDRYCVEVWGLDTLGPSLCTLYVYQLDPNLGGVISLTAGAVLSPAGEYPSAPVMLPQQELYMVDFVRGQLEIFAFKRFYQWVRQELAAIVKRDSDVRFFEPAGASPM